MLTGVDFDNSDIKFIGTADIDIEAIAAAKPDLIITEPTRNTPVGQLEKIAPTVSIDHLDGGAPEIYRKLAQLTGTQARLAILERRYQEQIKALRATIDTRKISVSVIQANQGKITAMFHFFGDVGHPFGSLDLVQIHRQQPFGKQHLLGIKQLIELAGGLVPGNDACGEPRGQGQHQKKQRQAQLQAQALGQFHASPRV